MSDTFKSFDVFELSKKLVIACYALTATLPPEEKTALTQYIRQAALSTHLNILQCTFLKKKKGRRKNILAAKNSLVVIDAVIEVLIEVKLVPESQTAEVMQLSSACYQLLDRLKKEK